MTGIRVTGVPDEVSEKQLKAHFSSPKNGGGPIRQIYYPLQGHSAVILFDSPTVMMEIFKTKHHLAGYELEIFPLPRQIYEKGIMEIEKGVSVLLSFHPAIIDELQYIGNLKVDFDYNQECYMLKGNWYQLEWALLLLDRNLDTVEGIQKVTHEAKPKKKAPQEDSPRSGSPERSALRRSPSPTLRGQSSPLLPESPTLRSQSPTLRSPSPTLRSASPDRDPFSSITQTTGYAPPAYKSLFHDDVSRPKEHKHMYGHDKRSQAPGRKNKNKNPQAKTGQNKNTTGPPTRPEPTYRDTKKGPAPRGRGVAFGRDTDFSENKPRLTYSYKPKREGPQMTSGLDVALTNFGEKQLSFSFELNGCLKVMVVKADITKQRTDGIVSPNTPGLSNSYGVASAIARAADKRFQIECQRYVQENGPLKMAEVMHTDAGGNLNHHVGFILHVVGPNWQEKDSDASMHYLVCTYLNCFHYSETVLWMKSLSTPLISAGAFGFPLDACIQAFFDALLIHVTNLGQSPHLQEICLVCFDSDSAGAAIMILQSLLEVDRKHSESEALFRYNTGCSKYGFHAKTMKTTPDHAVGIPNAEEEFKIIGKRDPEDKESSDSDELDDESEKKGIVNRDKNDMSYNSTATRSPDVKLESEQPLIFSNTVSKSKEVIVDDIVEVKGKPVSVLSEESLPRQELSENVSEKYSFSAKEEVMIDKDDTEETLQHDQDKEVESKDLENKEAIVATETVGAEGKQSGDENDDYEAEREETAVVIKDGGHAVFPGKFDELEIEEQKKVDVVEVQLDDMQNEQFKSDDTGVIKEKAGKLRDEDTTIKAEKSESKLDGVHKEGSDDLQESSAHETDINKLENKAERNEVRDESLDFETLSKDVEAETVCKDEEPLPQVEDHFKVEFESKVLVQEKTPDLLETGARMTDPDSELTVDPDVQQDTLKSASGAGNDSVTDEERVKSDEGEDFSQSQWSIIPENLVAHKIEKEEDEESL